MNTAELKILIDTEENTPIDMYPKLGSFLMDTHRSLSTYFGEQGRGIKIRIIDTEGKEIFPQGFPKGEYTEYCRKRFKEIHFPDNTETV